MIFYQVRRFFFIAEIFLVLSSDYRFNSRLGHLGSWMLHCSANLHCRENKNIVVQTSPSDVTDRSDRKGLLG